MITVRISGTAVASRYLNELAVSCRIVNGQIMLVTSDETYAYGINFGTRRNGRLARRAGGAHFMEAAATYLRTNARAVLATSMERGPSATSSALRSLGEGAVAAARARTPRVSGRLAGSLRSVLGGAGLA